MKDTILNKNDLRFEDDMFEELQQCVKIREGIYNDININNMGFSINTSKHLKDVSLLKTQNEVLKRFATSLLID